LIFGPRHLDRVLRIYLEHYNQQRPHRGLHIQRRDLLGGLIHEYKVAA
jgi:hypothetical protein